MSTPKYCKLIINNAIAVASSRCPTIGNVSGISNIPMVGLSKKTNDKTPITPMIKDFMSLQRMVLRSIRAYFNKSGNRTTNSVPSAPVSASSNWPLCPITTIS